MGASYVDLRLVESVWHEISKGHEPHLEEKVNAVRTKYEGIRAKLATSMTTESATLKPKSTTASEPTPAARSAQVAVSVLAFVARACDYYDTVRVERPLTDQEKLVGRDLSSLLEQAERILPPRST